MSFRTFMKIFLPVWGGIFGGVPLFIAFGSGGAIEIMLIPFFILGGAAFCTGIYLIVSDIAINKVGERRTGRIVSVEEDRSYSINDRYPLAIGIGFLDQNGSVEYKLIKTTDTVYSKYNIGDKALVATLGNRNVILNVESATRVDTNEIKIFEDYSLRTGTISGAECKSCGADVKIINGVGVCEYCGEVMRL